MRSAGAHLRHRYAVGGCRGERSAAGGDLHLFLNYFHGSPFANYSITFTYTETLFTNKNCIVESSPVSLRTSLNKFTDIGTTAHMAKFN